MLARPSITEILSYTQQIGAADLLAFAGGAIPVVPPPGNGKVILPLSVMMIYNFNSVDFSNSAPLNIKYHGDAGFLLIGSNAGLTGNGESTMLTEPLGLSFETFKPTSALINQGLDLVLVSGAFALAGVGTASLTAGGTGYAIGDTGIINTGNADATYRVLTVSGLGAVLTFAITFPGSTYATGAGQATATGGAQPGVGINFTVDVLTLVNGNGSIKVTTLYQVIDVP